MLPLDQLKTLSETGRDGVCQITRVALEGQEKMIGLNIDAAQEFIRKSSAQFEQTWFEMAHIDPGQALPYLLMSNIKCGTAISQLFLGLAMQLQKDLATIAQERQHALNATMVDEVNKYASVSKKIASVAIRPDEHHGHKYRQTA